MTARRQALAVAVIGVSWSPVLYLHITPGRSIRTCSVTVKGTVTGLSWSNPHVEIFVDAREENGNVEKWTVGGPSPSRLTDSGLNKNVLKPGDIITAVGYRATDGTRLLRTETIALSNGQTLSFYGNR